MESYFFSLLFTFRITKKREKLKFHIHEFYFSIYILHFTFYKLYTTSYHHKVINLKPSFSFGDSKYLLNT